MTWNNGGPLYFTSLYPCPPDSLTPCIWINIPDEPNPIHPCNHVPMHTCPRAHAYPPCACTLPSIDFFQETKIPKNWSTEYLGGHFNKDLALKGQHLGHHNIFPTKTNTQWSHFANQLELEYISTNTPFTHQGGPNYNSHNLTNGFFIHKHNPQLYTSYT